MCVNNGTLNVKGPITVNGIIGMTNGNINIEKGTFNGFFRDYAASGKTTVSSVIISGGTFNAVHAASSSLFYSGIAPATTSITGGSFKFDPTTYVAEGYVVTESEGTYTVGLPTEEPEPPTTEPEPPTTEPEPEEPVGTDPVSIWNANYASLFEGQTGAVVTNGCPFCDAEGDVTWTAQSGNRTKQLTLSAGHYYLSGDQSVDAEVSYRANANTCLYLNGNDMTGTGSFRTVTFTVNIFGTGTYTRLASDFAGDVFYHGATGVLNIYGGTYTKDDAEAGFATSSQGTTNVYGGTFNVDPSKYTTYECISQNTEAGTWTVEAEKHTFGEDGNAQNCTVCGAENPGYVAPEPVFEEVCAHCKEVPAEGWTRITGNSLAEITADGHYYLDADWNKTAQSITLPAYNICLHLNGHSITNNNTATTKGRCLQVSNGQTVNIMGSGTVSTERPQGAIYVTNGTVNVYGGEYVADRAFHVNGDNVVVNVYGGTYTGTYNVPNGTLNIVGGTFGVNPAAYIAEGKWAPALGNGTYLVTDKAAAAVIANGEYTAYENAAAALAAYSSNGYIKLGDAASIELASGDYYVDANGNAVTVTGAGTLYPVGEGIWNDLTNINVVRDFVSPFTAKRYLTVGKGTAASYEFDLKLSQVVLRAGYGETADEMGLFYKATIDTAQALADKIIAYGTVFSLTDVPGADVLEDETNLFTMFEIPVVLGTNGKLTTNSGIVKGIFKTTNEAGTNTANGLMPIFANAYIAIDLNEDGIIEYVMADTVNGGKNDADDGFTGVAYSLKDVLVAINGLAEVPELAKNFYAFWAEHGMDAWAAELPNLQTVAEETPAV
jgi:hypothetical protein